MFSHSPTAHNVTSHAPTGKARKALFVGVPVPEEEQAQQTEEAEGESKTMAKVDAIRHIPVAVPVRQGGNHVKRSEVAAAAASDVDPEFQQRVSKGTIR